MVNIKLKKNNLLKKKKAQIIITRSLGDHLMKTFIIAKPYTHHEYLTDKDQFLIIACDGVFFF